MQGAAADVGAVEQQDDNQKEIAARIGNGKPLFKDFMGINGHFTFKPELYRQVGRLVRNYHNVNWDVKQPGDAITIPVCVNKVNWKNDVYGRWQKAGYETDICIQFSGFQTDVADYQRFWTGKEGWCYDYGKAMADYFGPSGQEKLCTSIEIGNEPGSKFDRGLFKTIFKQMALGIREGDPRVKILTPAVQARRATTIPRTCVAFTPRRRSCPFTTSSTCTPTPRWNERTPLKVRGIAAIPKIPPSPTSRWWTKPLPGATRTPPARRSGSPSLATTPARPRP